jgi:hypothetical protein
MTSRLGDGWFLRLLAASAARRPDFLESLKLQATSYAVPYRVLTAIAYVQKRRASRKSLMGFYLWQKKIAALANHNLYLDVENISNALHPLDGGCLLAS